MTAGLTNGNGDACGAHPHHVNAGGSLSPGRRKEPPLLNNGSTSQPRYTPLQDITSVCNVAAEPHSPLTTSSSTAAAATGNQPLCEAYVMTGERVLKLTKNPSLAPKYQKKVDSLKTQQNFRKSSAAAAAAASAASRHNKSTPSSPVESEYMAGADEDDEPKSASANTSPITLGAPLKLVEAMAHVERNAGAFVASVSKSDDYIQYRKGGVSVSSTSVQVDDEDITSSLNTLLDTKNDDQFRQQQQQRHHKTVEAGTGLDDDDQRVLWSCTAAVRPNVARSTSTIASSENVSSQPSITPPSPTSVSSSVMSSSSSSDRKRPQGSSPHRRRHHANSGANSVDSSQIEALSNISSPDYQEETSDLLNSNDIGMEVTDPSDSDSTLLASEPKIRRLNKCVGSDAPELNGVAGDKSNHRIVIQVGRRSVVLAIFCRGKNNVGACNTREMLE